jgi:hypothetical protein
MPPSGDDPEISILDARLAEIDRRLHSIQTGLVEAQPPAALPPRIAVPGDHPRPSAGPGGGPSETLASGSGPSGGGPSAALEPGEAQAAAEMLSRLCELVATQEGMLTSMRQLLAAAQRRADAAWSPHAAQSPHAARSPHAAQSPQAAWSPEGVSPIGVRAGPFATTAALRSFRAALEALPGVRAVELRGFEGADRAILDVHL